jgi:hypothetical protein
VTDQPNIEAPKLTPTQRLHEITLAALHKTPVKASESVELTRNAKGDWQYTVAGVAGEADTLAEVATRVLNIARDLDKDLPLSRSQHFGRDYLPNEKDAVKRGTAKVES